MTFAEATGCKDYMRGIGIDSHVNRGHKRGYGSVVISEIGKPVSDIYHLRTFTKLYGDYRRGGALPHPEKR